MFSLTNIAPENVRSVWLSIRGDYSRRQLSYAGDKLVAIAAVAEVVGQSYRGRYLAGMWEEDLVQDLKWVRGDGSLLDAEGEGEGEILSHLDRRKWRYDTYVAPSWSWASVRGPVDDWGFDEHGDADGGSSESELGFRIFRVDVEPMIPGYAFGALKSGVLVVEGRMREFVWRPEDDEENRQCDGFLAIESEREVSKEEKVGGAVMDAPDSELVDGCTVECIALGLEERIPEKMEVECLMLLAIEKGVYRRVGFCRIWDTKLFDAVEVVGITLR